MNMLTMKKSQVTKPGEAEPLASLPFRARIPGYTIRVLALLGIVLLIWKVIAVSVLENEQEDALQALRDSTEQRIAQRTSLLAKTAGISLGQSISFALRTGNIQSAERLCNTLVQRSAVKDYIVTNVSGTIVAAMHREMVGEALETNLRRATASLDEPLVDTIENGLTRVIVPLGDEGGAIGTAILTLRLP